MLRILPSIKVTFYLNVIEYFFMYVVYNICAFYQFDSFKYNLLKIDIKKSVLIYVLARTLSSCTLCVLKIIQTPEF